jgi:transposase InsO family protein
VTLHPNAKTTPYQRQLLVERVLRLGWAMADACQAAGISLRTGYRWLRRFRDGDRELQDRSCRPHRTPRRTSAARERKIERLRRRRRTAAWIARRLGMARSTVSAVLTRLGLERLSKLDPKPAVQRYERERAGELLHFDIKKLGKIRGIGHRIHGDRRTRSRGVGWEFVHVCIDDASRTGYAEVLPDERSETAEAFLRRAVRWFRKRGIEVDELLTDNGPCYVSHRFNDALDELGIQHRYTRAYRPQTNGKAERFIQTLLREWAYARAYRTSNQRAKALPKWLRSYNEQRPHSALKGQPPMSRLRRDRGV